MLLRPENNLRVCVCGGFRPAPQHPCRRSAAVAEIIKMRGRQSETPGSFMMGEKFCVARIGELQQEGVPSSWIPGRWVVGSHKVA